MNQDYIKPDNWSIIEEGFDPEQVKSSESLFSIGNGAMGQRANFEERYTGPTFQGSYIAGVYYPDKTRVGWWKNGYPEYFAKVINAPSWIGIDVEINGEPLDLHTCKAVTDFRRELNMKEGWYQRSFQATMPNDIQLEVKVLRFLSLVQDELGAIRYSVTPLNQEAEVIFSPYLDSGIKNEDSNWDDQFWNTTEVLSEGKQAFIEAHTMKTHFETCTFMENMLFIGKEEQEVEHELKEEPLKVTHTYTAKAKKGEEIHLIKYAGYTVSRNHKADALIQAAKETLSKARDKGFDQLLAEQINAWSRIWEMSDITIKGDQQAQQGIRFNIFQLNQTYLGTDSRLNIGPKGFTGEKYGGSTYWDTEAYCIPFYMATKDHHVARKLLKYRYNHLERAIENAEKLGFDNGAALYP
ncbi:MAG: glycoside hydrolase family 65 protein, partial [Eudoraea sp.]|nr:glycoside hydrolase family 65 protein [Eudoraea sp.]